METRKITIISTKSNRKITINTNATTLRGLKSALREANVDFRDMTFYEGLTKTELLNDDSLLPHDVQRINPTTREPEITNELVFMLTNVNKKIRSGSMSRSEVFNIIKEKNLQEECFTKTGKNFTRCKTADLIRIIEEHSKPEFIPETTSEIIPESNSSIDINARKAISYLAWYLGTENNDVIEEVDKILGNTYKDSDSPYSDDEIDAMFKDIVE